MAKFAKAHLASGHTEARPQTTALISLIDCVSGYNSSDFITQSKSMELVYAILKAILAHLYIAWIHPFGDGNGRTARLLEFQILLSAGVPAPAAHLLSNHYNLTRMDYYQQLDRASKSGGDVVPFITHAVQGFLDGLHGQLRKIKGQVLDEVWQSWFALRNSASRRCETYVRKRGYF